VEPRARKQQIVSLIPRGKLFCVFYLFFSLLFSLPVPVFFVAGLHFHDGECVCEARRGRENHHSVANFDFFCVTMNLPFSPGKRELKLSLKVLTHFGVKIPLSCL
jgi:hypothetical protein